MSDRSSEVGPAGGLSFAPSALLNFNGSFRHATELFEAVADGGVALVSPETERHVREAGHPNLTRSFERMIGGVDETGPSTPWSEVSDGSSVYVVPQIPADALSDGMRELVEAETPERIEDGQVMLGNEGTDVLERREPLELPAEPESDASAYGYRSTLGPAESETAVLADGLGVTQVSDEVVARSFRERLGEGTATGTIGLLTSAVGNELVEPAVADEFVRSVDAHDTLPVSVDHPTGPNLTLGSLVSALDREFAEQVVTEAGALEFAEGAGVGTSADATRLVEFIDEQDGVGSPPGANARTPRHE